jgi:hypothetical protein
MLSGNGSSQNNTIECSKNPDAMYAGILLDLKLIVWYALSAHRITGHMCLEERVNFSSYV